MAVTAASKAAMQKGRVEKARSKKAKKEAARARVSHNHNSFQPSSSHSSRESFLSFKQNQNNANKIPRLPLPARLDSARKVPQLRLPQRSEQIVTKWWESAFFWYDILRQWFMGLDDQSWVVRRVILGDSYLL